MVGKEEIQAIEWFSWTCVLGPEVHGNLPKYTQVRSGPLYCMEEPLDLGILLPQDHISDSTLCFLSVLLSLSILFLKLNY